MLLHIESVLLKILNIHKWIAAGNAYFLSEIPKKLPFLQKKPYSSVTWSIGARLIFVCFKFSVIRVKCPCNVDPLTPLLYSKSGVYRGIHYFLIFAPKHVHTIYVLSKNKKIINPFHLKIFFFTAVKYCKILLRHVCVMWCCLTSKESPGFTIRCFFRTLVFDSSWNETLMIR